jgi:hypothetical protein
MIGFVMDMSLFSIIPIVYIPAAYSTYNTTNNASFKDFKIIN